VSVYVRIEVEVAGCKPEHEAAVVEAIQEAAPFSLPDDYSWGSQNRLGRVLCFSGESSCSYSCLEEETMKAAFVPAITEANGGVTPEIKVTIQWLEQCPYDTFYLSDEEGDDA
jgi:hypothetical protein